VIFAANNVSAGKYWVSAMSMGCPSMLRWCDKVTDPIIDLEKDVHLNCINQNRRILPSAKATATLGSPRFLKTFLHPTLFSKI
jgi:hypothetical protein